MRNRQPKRDIQEKVVFDAIVYKHGITAQSKALLDPCDNIIQSMIIGLWLKRSAR